MNAQLTPVTKKEDILKEYLNTPIGDLLEYHNLDRKLDPCTNAKILVGMCMDNRKHLNIPDNFAFIIRTGGANLRYSEFRVSYAIAVGGVKYITLIGHTNCGMVNLVARKEQFIDGLIERAGWTHDMAEEHFMHYEPIHEIGDEINFILSETKRLRFRYPKIVVAPMLYRVEDNKLYQINEEC